MKKEEVLYTLEPVGSADFERIQVKDPGSCGPRAWFDGGEPHRQIAGGPSGCVYYSYADLFVGVGKVGRYVYCYM